jgi:hypothetical protein
MGDSIKKDIKEIGHVAVDWIQLAQYMIKEVAVIETLMHLRVS